MSLEQLDEGQRQAVTSRNRYILCLAGAGSGKTRVLTQRIAHLVKERHVSPASILAITFTRNAAGEMSERLLSLGIGKAWCKTFHSTCYHILQNEDCLPQGKLLTEHEQLKLLSTAIEHIQKDKDTAYRLHQFLQDVNWTMDLFIEEILQVISEIKNRSISDKLIISRCQKSKDEEVKEFYRFVLMVKNRYSILLTKHKSFDYSDLITKTSNLLANNSEVREKYQSQFEHVLVDEYQDVNFAQVELLDLLLSPKTNMFIVGDDWQAIYGWRGSSVSYILDFPKKHKDTEIICLPKNYRSDAIIVKASSKLIRHNRKQYRKQIRPFHPASNRIAILAAPIRDHQVFLLEKSLAGLPQSSGVMILGRTHHSLLPYQDIPGKYQNRKITLSTIHGVKGMESDVVFVVGLKEGRRGFPHVREDEDIISIVRNTSPNEKLEEERRCFYVAMTRAKKKLFLVCDSKKPSRFITEIPRRSREIVR